VTFAGPAYVPILPDEADIDRVFAMIREARIGGPFWAPPRDERPTLIVRAASAAEAGALLAGMDEADRASAFCLPPADDADPWPLLTPGTRLVAHGDDELAALAHIAGCAVQLLSAGRFGATESDIRGAVAREIFGRRYRDPFTGQGSDICATIELLAEWRRILAANRGIVVACGMAWWKRHEIGRFLWKPGQSLRFFRSGRRAVLHAKRLGGAVAIWPSRVTPSLIERAHARGVALIRVEDGFIRSMGLGANLVPPSSITVDRLGIHYDPCGPSDMERLLAESTFPPPLIERAQALRSAILRAGIGKYGRADSHVFPAREPDRRLVLVPGQVEDDMSVLKGGHGLSSNLELLRRARALEPDAEIWFRPHPDVDAGHRNGVVHDDEALIHADQVIRGGAMARLLDVVDAVHVLTSLTGFEALMRGLDVTCHGTPFYAGWGLTRDLTPIPDRRGRALSVDELVAGVLILYPRYLDPVTGLPCRPEVLIRRMAEGTARNRLGWVSRIRKLQGRLMRHFA